MLGSATQRQDVRQERVICGIAHQVGVVVHLLTATFRVPVLEAMGHAHLAPRRKTLMPQRNHQTGRTNASVLGVTI